MTEDSHAHSTKVQELARVRNWLPLTRLVRWTSGNFSEIVLNCCGTRFLEYEIFVGVPMYAIAQDIAHSAPYTASLPTRLATFAIVAAVIIAA